MDYPDYKTYEILYAKYLQGNRTEQLLDLAGDLKGKVVADLCGGNGRLSRKAAEREPSKIYLVEECGKMLGIEFSSKVTFMIDDVLTFCYRLDHGCRYYKKIDVSFCQQAINYWLTPEMVKELYHRTKKEGLFIFNTFRYKPSKIPVAKEYFLKGRKYVEISYFISQPFSKDINSFSDVHHVQVCEGLEPHCTYFKWMSHSYIKNCLCGLFEIVEHIKDDKTSVYKCKKI